MFLSRFLVVLRHCAHTPYFIKYNECIPDVYRKCLSLQIESFLVFYELIKSNNPCFALGCVWKGLNR